MVHAIGHDFAETLSETNAIEQGLLPPAGLVNLVNTCYANSVIQVIHKIPEVVDSVEATDLGASESGTPRALVSKLKETFEQMDSSRSAIRPFAFISVVHANGFDV